MIKTLSVNNFKSVKKLNIECRKINIFIGRPNTGKSNILEALGLFSISYEEINKFIRCDNIANLFYENNYQSEKLTVSADTKEETQGFSYEIKFSGGKFIAAGSDRKKLMADFSFAADASGIGKVNKRGEFPIKYYKFMPLSDFNSQRPDFLKPVFGENLPTLILSNKSLSKMIKDILGEFGIRLALKPHENKIEIQKETGDVIVLYPYNSASDTLRRLIFYLAALETNKNSVLLFEEPESFAFPYYTKFLAERIAFDETNQFFITTHNPYLLLPLLEKAHKEDISIFVTSYEDHQTEVKALSDNDMEELLSMDASLFFNLDRFTGDK